MGIPQISFYGLGVWLLKVQSNLYSIYLRLYDRIKKLK
jgi:hypothetical protein